MADHPKLLETFRDVLTPGGQIAIQVPANDDHVTHEAARTVARREPFRSALSGWVRAVAVLSPELYSAALYELGFARQNVVLKVYPHVLESRGAIVEWVKGTMLTDYQRRLPGELWAAFLAAYEEELFRHVPDSAPRVLSVQAHPLLGCAG